MRITLQFVLPLFVVSFLGGCIVEETVNGEAKKPSSGFSMSPGVKITRTKRSSEKVVPVTQESDTEGAASELPRSDDADSTTNEGQ